MADSPPSPAPARAQFSCGDQQLAEVLSLIGGRQALANTICSTYDCSLSTATCVLQYITTTQLQLGLEQQDSKQQVQLGLDVAFLLFSAALVFLMQLGFALLCAGAIRSKNSMNILLKNVLDACMGAVAFYLFGYAFAYGHQLNKRGNAFIGDWNFALSYTRAMSRDDSAALFDGFATQGWHVWFYQWSFSAAATTIVSGAMAERTTFVAYLAYAFYVAAFVYPVVVHWVWSPDGWLSAYNTSNKGNALILRTGAIDFAGSGVVHMVGGFAGLMGAWLIGPRIGRFDASGKVNDMRGHSATLVVMGTLLIWFGFYGFNPGSNVTVSSTAAAITVSRVAVVTTLCAASAGLVTLAYKYVVSGVWDLVAVCNGTLAGLAASAAPCSVIEPWAGLICGAVAALLFCKAERVCLYRMKIDDPVSAWALHGVAGAWGVFFVGLLAHPQFVEDLYGTGTGAGLKPAIKGKRFGIFYGGHGQLLLCQTIEIVVVIAWTCLMMGAFFYALRLAKLLRVSVESELAGLDMSKHGVGGGGGLGELAGLEGADYGASGGLGAGYKDVDPMAVPLRRPDAAAHPGLSTAGGASANYRHLD